MSEITVSRPEVVNGHTDVICSTQYPPHSGCTKEYTAANRHTYPATGRNLSNDRQYWR